jgi:hypothetical protein
MAIHISTVLVALFLVSGSAAIATAQTAPVNVPAKITGCVKELELFTFTGFIRGQSFTKTCKYITVGDKNYIVVTRSEMIYQRAAEAYALVKPIPTGKQVTVYGTYVPGLAEVLAFSCLGSGIPVIPRYTTSWTPVTPEKKCSE